MCFIHFILDKGLFIFVNNPSTIFQVELAPARVTLGVTTFLAIMGQTQVSEGFSSFFSSKFTLVVIGHYDHSSIKGKVFIINLILLFLFST